MHIVISRASVPGADPSLARTLTALIRTVRSGTIVQQAMDAKASKINEHEEPCDVIGGGGQGLWCREFVILPSWAGVSPEED